MSTGQKRLERLVSRWAQVAHAGIDTYPKGEFHSRSVDLADYVWKILPRIRVMPVKKSTAMR